MWRVVSFPWSQTLTWSHSVTMAHGRRMLASNSPEDQLCLLVIYTDDHHLCLPPNTFIHSKRRNVYLKSLFRRIILLTTAIYLTFQIIYQYNFHFVSVFVYFCIMGSPPCIRLSWEGVVQEQVEHIWSHHYINICISTIKISSNLQLRWGVFSDSLQLRCSDFVCIFTLFLPLRTQLPLSLPIILSLSQISFPLTSDFFP